MRLVTITLGLCLLAGCAVGQLSQTPVLDTSTLDPTGTAGPIIDLAKGARTHPGWAPVTLQIAGLAQDRSAQSLSSAGATLLIAATDYQHHTLTDGNGNAAIYKATVSGGAATVVLPPLPPTANTINPTAPSAKADIFSTFLLKSSFPVSTPPKFTDLQNYGTDTANPWSLYASGDPVIWNHIDYDLLDGPDATPAHSEYLLGTGEAAADVAAGYPLVVPLTNWYMVGAKFNETSPPANYSGADESAVYVSGFSLTSGGTLNLREPGFVNSQLTNFSGEVMRFVVNYSAINGPAVHLTTQTFDNTNPSGSPSDIGVPNLPLTALTVGQSNALTQGITADTDIDVSAISSPTNLDFTLTGLPSGATLLLMDRNAYGALSDNFVGSSVIQ